MGRKEKENGMQFYAGQPVTHLMALFCIEIR
jgi:hypothetical protein